MTRKSLAACASLVSVAMGTALVLSGCGASSAVSSAVDPVAQAAELSELSPGFKVSIYEQLRASGTPVSVASGTEDFERSGQRAFVSLYVRADGKSLTSRDQYADGAIYMQLPGTQSSPLTHGKKWIEYDINDVEDSLGIDLGSLSGATSADPRQQLSYLRAVGAVTRLGSQQVHGVATTHYRARIYWQRYPERVAPSERAAARASVAALERLTGSSSQTVEVWIDAEHRVRREDFTYSECLPQTNGRAQIALRTEYYDFGPQAIPKLPPNSEVADVTNVIARDLKHVKLGCS